MGRKTSRLPPIAVKRTLRILGSNLRDARRRRRIPMALMAERVGVTRATLTKLERGDPSVSMGVYATAIFVLGFIDRLTDLASPGLDEVGLALEEERLPQRIRLKKCDTVP